MAIRIVTDSCSDLPAEAARTNGITVVPLYVIIGGETYRDGVDITAADFYSRLVELPSLPTTSQPSVADFQEVYRRLLGEGHQIVSIHVSSKLSGTLNSAAQARESLGAAAQQIEVVDSRLAGGAHRPCWRSVPPGGQVRWPTIARWLGGLNGRLGGFTASYWSTP